MSQGSQGTALKLQSVITRKVSVKSIEFRKETNPRLEVNEDRVAFFQDLFANPDHKVPPLEVLFIQTGDPKSAVYLGLDGGHRLEALKRIGASDALCNVHSEPSYTLLDLDDEKVLGRILEMSCPYNVGDDIPLPLSVKERRVAASRFKDLKYTHERIAKALGVDIRTVKRWLVARNKEKKQRLKECILDELRKGVSVNDLVHRYGDKSKDDYVPETTIRRWRKDASSDPQGEAPKVTNVTFGALPGAGEIVKPEKPLVDGDPLDIDLLPNENQLSGSDGDAEKANEEVDRTMGKLRQIDDLIAQLPWCGDADDYIIADHLPCLAKKSPTLKTALSTEGISAAYEDLRGRYEDERMIHADTRALSLERQRRIEELEEENRRLRNTSESSEHSREWARKVVHQSLSGHLDILELLRTAITDQRITSPMKRVTIVPKEAEGPLNDIALACSYRVVAHLEWAALHHLLTEKTVSSFYRFLEMIEPFPTVNDKAFMQRIRKLDRQFSAGLSLENIQEESYGKA